MYFVDYLFIPHYFNCKYTYLIKEIEKWIYGWFQTKTTPDITSADWVLDEKELTEIFNDRTKIIILNTPNNPTGKVYTRKEMEFIASLCKKYDVLCLSDEVYEWMVYEPKKHIHMG